MDVLSATHGNSTQPIYPIFPTEKGPTPTQPVEPLSNCKAVITVPKQRLGKREKRPWKAGNALRRGAAAAIKFVICVERTPMEDHGGQVFIPSQLFLTGTRSHFARAEHY